MMSKKIEINTLVTKHENKCKGCRFEMIDVEDPLWEYGYPLKRVLIDNQTGEIYDSVSKLVGLLNEQQVTIKRLQKHLDYEMEEHTEKTFEMLEFMKEKGVFDEYYGRVKKEVLDDE